MSPFLNFISNTQLWIYLWGPLCQSPASLGGVFHFTAVNSSIPGGQFPPASRQFGFDLGTETMAVGHSCQESVWLVYTGSAREQPYGPGSLQIVLIQAAFPMNPSQKWFSFTSNCHHEKRISSTDGATYGEQRCHWEISFLVIPALLLFGLIWQ